LQGWRHKFEIDTLGDGQLFRVLGYELRVGMDFYDREDYYVASITLMFENRIPLSLK